jgi:superfamily I DNA and/or RNA helicase
MTSETATLTLSGLPPRVSKGAILRLLIEEGGVKKGDIGRILVSGKQCRVEMPASSLPHLIKLFDGYTFEHTPIQATGEWQGDLNAHLQKLADLLEIEAKAEKSHLQNQSDDQKERDRAFLSKLVIRGDDIGMGDKILLKLGRRNQTEKLPFTKLRVGSPVVMQVEGDKNSPAWRGVVSQMGRALLQVAFSQPPDPEYDQATFRLDLAPDEVTRQRQLNALQRAQTARGDRLAELSETLLGKRPAQFSPAVQPDFLDRSLNAEQQEAVVFAMSAEDVAIVHGPPGTGKTTTIVEVIRQAVRSGKRVLATAPSNMGVDNLVGKLLACGESVVRLGHPVRVMPAFHDHILDNQVAEHPYTQQAHKYVRQARKLFAKADRFTRAKPLPGEKQSLRNEAKQLLDEARKLEAHAINSVLDNATILCATTTSLTSSILGQRHFDLCVLDEASQSTEPNSWLPLVWADKLILAGDHQQLPPTILSAKAERAGLGVSLMERLMLVHGDEWSRQLCRQYRMNSQIMGFSSAEFYDDTLIADPAVQHHLLNDLPTVAETPLTTTPLYFIDTAGASYDEELEPDGDSRRNPQEATLVAKKVAELIEAGVAPAEIAVIAPYSAQVRLLEEVILRDDDEETPALEINSIDGFQGREKEVIIISLVRSNIKGEIGFLAEYRRMNVALTRARRLLIVIGDSATITADPFYQRWLDYVDKVGAYHSVWEENYQ